MRRFARSLTNYPRCFTDYPATCPILRLTDSYPTLFNLDFIAASAPLSAVLMLNMSAENGDMVVNTG